MSKNLNTLLVTIVVLGLLTMSTSLNNIQASPGAHNSLVAPTPVHLDQSTTITNLSLNLNTTNNGSVIHLVISFDVATTEQWNGEADMDLNFYDQNTNDYLGYLYIWEPENTSIDQSFVIEKDIPSSLNETVSIDMDLTVYTIRSDGFMDTSASISQTVQNIVLTENSYFHQLSFTYSFQGIDLNKDTYFDAMLFNFTLNGPAYPFTPLDPYHSAPELSVNYVIYNHHDFSCTNSAYFSVYHLNTSFTDMFLPPQDDDYYVNISITFLDYDTFMSAHDSFYAPRTNYYRNTNVTLTAESIDSNNDNYTDTIAFHTQYYSDATYGPWTVNMDIEVYKYDTSTSTYQYYNTYSYYLDSNSVNGWTHASRYFHATTPGDYQFNIQLTANDYNPITLGNYTFTFTLEASSLGIDYLEWNAGYYCYLTNMSAPQPDTIDLVSNLSFQNNNNTAHNLTIEYIVDYDGEGDGNYVAYDAFMHNITTDTSSYVSVVDDLDFTAHDTGKFKFTILLYIDGSYYGYAEFKVYLMKYSGPEFTYDAYVSSYTTFDSNHDQYDDAVNTSLTLEISGNNVAFPVNTTINAIIYYYNSTTNNYEYLTTQTRIVNLYQYITGVSMTTYFNATGDYSIDYYWNIANDHYFIGNIQFRIDTGVTTTTSTTTSTNTTTSTTTSTSITETTSNTTTTQTNSTSPPPLPMPVNPIFSIILPLVTFAILTIQRKQHTK